MTSQASATCSFQGLQHTTTACLHCGNRLSRADVSFCCRGCETVFHLLEQRGLTRYYDLQKTSDSNRNASVSVDADAEKLDFLDDQEFIKDYASSDGLEMRFYLEGVHCAACVWLTEKLPDFVAEVQSLRLNLSDGVAVIRLKSPGGFSAAAKELARLGYRSHPVKSDESEAHRRREARVHLIQMGIAAAAAGNIMLLAVALYAGASNRMGAVFQWVSFVLYLPVFFYCAIPFHRGAWVALKNCRISIDVPIAFGIWVGTIVSVFNVLSGSDQIYFDSLSALVFLLLSTRYLLRKVNERSLNARKWVYFLAPSMSHLEQDVSGSTSDVRTDSLRAGDIIHVFQGESFPVDGEVLSGESTVDRALLSGESEPMVVSQGERVHAGTQNCQAPLRVKVLSSGAETRLGKLLTAMHDGLARQAPIVAFVDQVGQAFVAAVLVFVALAFAVGFSVSLHEAFNRALAAAIIVCPCTFALATPLAMSLAISRAARAGILIRGADVVERLSRVKSAFFDKTGTLTHGALQVLDWCPLEPRATEVLIALEERSTHPVAKAVQRYFELNRQAKSELPRVSQFSEKAGEGILATIGSSSYELRRLDQAANSADRAEGAAPIVSAIALFRDKTLIGRLYVGDCIRDDAKSSIEGLAQLKVNAFVVSGDSELPAARVGEMLKLPSNHVFSKQAPEEKAQLLKRFENSLMVGDGANDALALSTAYVSIAVQGGMEISMQAAGAYLSRSGLSGIPDLIVLAKETMHLIYRNLTFAILYNVIGIIAAVSGHLDPLFAAVLMPLSAFTVFMSTILGTPRMRRLFLKASEA